MKRFFIGALAVLSCLFVVWPALALMAPARPPIPALPAVAEVSIAATPGSVCRFDPKAMPEDAKSPILPTDRTGHAHLYLSAPATKTKKAISVALVCEDAESRKTSVIAHVAPADFVARAVTPATAMKMPVATSHNGALSAGKIDVTTASDADLERLGYPARPDHVHAATAYAAWLYIVTTPGVYTKAPPISMPGKHAGPATLGLRGAVVKPDVGPPSSVISNKIWSGYNIIASPTFTQVNAQWVVPTVIPPPFTQTTEAVQWVGIDGGNEPDVIQDGTHTDSTVILCNTGGGTYDPPFPCNASFYYAWYEYFPDDEKGVNNFIVRPGDTMQVVTYVTTNGGVVTGHFTLWNMTLKQAQTFSESTPSGVRSALDQAEWVVERPTSDGDITLLTQTSPTNMNFAAFTRNGVPEQEFNAASQTLPIGQLAMTQDGSAVNANNLMSLGVAGTTSGLMSVFWYKFK